MNIESNFTSTVKQISNKKILLCERKRHTTRRVASACSAALSPDGRERGGGTPIQSQWGGRSVYPQPVPMGDMYPDPVIMCRRYPCQQDDGTPDQQNGGTITIRKDGSTPSGRIQYPPLAGWGTIPVRKEESTPIRKDWVPPSPDGVPPVSGWGYPAGC